MGSDTSALEDEASWEGVRWLFSNRVLGGSLRFVDRIISNSNFSSDTVVAKYTKNSNPIYRAMKRIHYRDMLSPLGIPWSVVSNFQTCRVVLEGKVAVFLDTVGKRTDRPHPQKGRFADEDERPRAQRRGSGGWPPVNILLLESLTCKV